jgi:hypothetical protein
MSRWRRFGLALAFTTTLASGVLISQPAQALTLNDAACAGLARAISHFEDVAAAHPEVKVLQLILQQLKDMFADRCS